MYPDWTPVSLVRGWGPHPHPSYLLEGPVSEYSPMQELGLWGPSRTARGGTPPTLEQGPNWAPVLCMFAVLNSAGVLSTRACVRGEIALGSVPEAFSFFRNNVLVPAWLD